MKGFKKNGKFRPTGNKSKSSLKKSDVIRKDDSVDIPNYLKKKPDLCSGEHRCPICKKTKVCTGGAFGHDSTKGQGVCHAKGEECICESCQDNRWDEVLEYHKKEGVEIPSRNKESLDNKKLSWKKMTQQERFDKITRDYYVWQDNLQQPQEFFDEADELASSERNMDAVVDYAWEIAESNEPPKEIVKHIRKLNKRDDER